jgi:hypothetical protein
MEQKPAGGVRTLNSRELAGHLERTLGRGPHIVELEGRPGAFGIVHYDFTMEGQAAIRKKRQELLGILGAHGFTVKRGAEQEGVPVTHVGIDPNADPKLQGVAAFAMRRFKDAAAGRPGMQTMPRQAFRRAG